MELLILGGLAFLVYFFSIMFTKTDEQKEYERKLKESLEDEYIIDPETGIRLTLEEAESGNWIGDNNEYITVPESEINKLSTEGEQQAESALNYLRESKKYIRTELSDNQLQILNSTKILGKYDAWTYSNPFSFENGILILPAPELNGMTYYEEDYKESHLMFWKKIDNINGHYFLREKSSIEKIFDKFRNDDDLKLKDYESFTFKRSYNVIKINKILENFKNEKGLEIEINDNDFFVKTMRLVSIVDIKKIETILKNVG